MRKPDFDPRAEPASPIAAPEAAPEDAAPEDAAPEDGAPEHAGPEDAAGASAAPANQAPAQIPQAPDGAQESYLRIETASTRGARGKAERLSSFGGSPTADAVGRATAKVGPSAAIARRRMSLQEQVRIRRPPSETEQARRRRLLTWTKWSLPLAALLLLGSIAVWPELNRAMTIASTGYRQAATVNVDSGKMLGARYRGLDTHGRPFMITADEARDLGSDRIELTHPIADTLSQNGSWVLVRAQSGLYMPHAQLLDLSDHVRLYRDDGTMMDGPTAVIDIRRGIVASDDWVHAEGPFGVLDAQGDLLSQRDGVLQFRGPARMILNDDRSTKGPKR